MKKITIKDLLKRIEELENGNNKDDLLQRYRETPTFLPSVTNTKSGEWCDKCGAWRQYGLPDYHHCTGYYVTC